MLKAKVTRLFDELGGIKQASRSMHPKKMFCLSLVLCAAVTAGAQQQQPMNTPLVEGAREPRILTLQECIQLALAHNLEIQVQQYNPLINEFALGINYAYYEPALGFRASHNFNSSPGGINPATGQPFPPNERSTDTYVPELSGFLPTGLSFDITGPLSKQTGTSVPLSTKYSSDPGITLRQPLLKNLWIDTPRLQIQLGKNAIKGSEVVLLGQVMTTVTSVQQAYYELVFARENVKVQAAALELAEQLLAENRKRVEVGALAPLDEKQAESQAAANRATLLLTQRQELAQENTLKSLLTDNYNEWVNISPVPSEGLLAIPQELNLQESWRLALAKRPDILEQKLTLERQNITVKYNFNQLFPTVDVTGSYGRNALNATFGGNLDDIRTGNNPFYSYGVVVSIPLGNGAARNAYKAAKASARQFLLQLKLLEQAAIVTVENDVAQVRTDLQTITARREARIYAESALEAEQKKLANGKSTSFIVLQLQINLTTARSTEIRALADYNEHLAQLALDEGSTLDKNHIDFKVK
ncbi:MAG: Outer rane efflux protein [Pedosphaera sp.]|nr:Outer rane efflux protein [Pedosphaera sp.]